MAEEIESGEQKVEVTQPIILNLGKQRRKRIKALMKGKGKLWFEVENVIEEVGTTLGNELDGKVVVPLILVYRRKPRRRRARRWFGL